MQRILIADDDTDILSITKFILEEKGLKIYTLQDDKKIFAAIEVFKPHLVLLDIKLPGADGREICKQLKQNYPFPVLLFSATSNLAQHAANSNADGYIEKPFDIHEFVSAVKNFLPVVKTGFVV